MASSSSLLGAAGEHYIMSELLRRGYIAALAPRGVPNTDIVVSDLQGSRLCGIQVKARRDLGSDGGWHMQQKHEDIHGDRLFYCFVDFGKTITARPIVHVVPCEVIAKALRESHEKWLSALGKNGRAHQDTRLRRLLPDYTRTFGEADNPYPAGWLDSYRDAWDLLQLDSEIVSG